MKGIALHFGVAIVGGVFAAEVDAGVGVAPHVLRRGSLVPLKLHTTWVANL